MREINVPIKDELTVVEKLCLWWNLGRDELRQVQDKENPFDAKVFNKNHPSESSIENPEPNESLFDHSIVEFAVSTRSFRWLVASMRRELGLDFNCATVFHQIRDELPSVLRFRLGSRALLRESAVIFLEWNPASFVAQQGYEGPNSILSALTLTGSASQAQMTTCCEYIRQTWPIIGEDVLDCLVTAVSRGPSATIKRKTLLTTESSETRSNGISANKKATRDAL